MSTPANLTVPQLLAAELSELGERHGFDIWRLVGAGERAAVGGLAAARQPMASTRPRLPGMSLAFTTLLDTLRAFEANIFGTPSTVCSLGC